ncbi:MAG: hypothetical protein ACYSVY_27590 [Planctomycetota bacterium]|jgi:hypothetical protein
MSDIKERQSSDSKQGGEGTNSLHNKGYDALTKDIGAVENTQAPEPDNKVGTK